MNALHRITLGLFSALLLAVMSSCAQEQATMKEDETKAQVPALAKFHTSIYKLWHTAWPKKDTEMLVALAPDIEKGVADVAGAALPGILRDKKAAWETNVKKLQDIAAEYKVAAGSADQQKLLDAAEKLHAQYEALVRVTRPPLKEIDAFHTILYPIYHYYLPQEDMAKLKTSVAQLKLKMDTLNTVTLPERQKKREEAFVAARAKLSTSVDGVVGAMATENVEKIKAAIHTMHANYEALEKVFE
jgi:hypothetical protein